MSNGITAENLLRALPDVLQQDDNMRALAEAIAGQLVPCIADTDEPRIFPRIDELNETLLDTLAWDFKVDWWDYSYSLQEKRNTLRQSWYVHKHMGTPAAVMAALSAIYPNSKVEEWWAYGGEPYHFRLLIPVDASTLDASKHATVLSLVTFYKNLRSVLDSVEYSGSTSSLTVYPMAAQWGTHIVNAGTAAGSSAGDQLLDELNDFLTDELNDILTDG
jgi:phage tail P2-like protein